VGAIKKIFIGLTAFVVLIIGVLAVIPLFYSIDDLRPQIREAIEKQVRGKVELGKLSLSLLPAVKVNIDGIKVTPNGPFGSEALADVKAVSLNMPLISFLTGPQVTVRVDEPKVHLISKGEQSNLTDLLPPPPPPGAESPTAAASGAAAKGEAPQSVEAILAGLPPWLATRVKAARLFFELKDGDAKIDDRLAKANLTSLHKLTLSLKNIGIAAPIGVAFSGDADLKSGDIRVTGPVRADGNVTVTPEGQGFRVAVDMVKDLTGIDAQMPALFHKKPGVPFKAGVKGVVLQQKTIDVDFNEVDFRFGDFSIKGQLEAKNVTDPKTATVALKMKTPSDAPIGPFGAIVPMIQDFKLDGKVGLDVDVHGTLTDPGFNILISLAGVTGATPELKQPVTDLTGRIAVTGSLKKPVLKIDPFTLKIAASDLAVKVETVGIDPITANIAVNSQRLDADQLLGLEALRLDVPAAPAPGAPAGAPGTAAGGAPAKGAKLPPAPPLDESLNALAPTLEQALANPMLDKASALVTMNFKSIRALGAEFKDAALNLTYAKRELKVFKTGIGGYGGKVDVAGAMGLEPKAPSFDFKFGLGGVSLDSMLGTHAPSWKGMLTGTMTGNMSIAGKGLRKEQLNDKLNGSVQGQILAGRLNLPIVKVISGAIDKLPKLAVAKVNEGVKDQEHHGEFKSMKLSALIKGRMVELKDLDIDYDTVKAGLGNFRFQATGNVSFDQQVDITGVAYLPPDVVRISELRGPSGKNEIPLRMTGPMAEPKPDYAYTLKILGPRLAQNALKSRAAEEFKARAAPAAKELEKKLAPEIKKLEEKAPEPVKQKVNDLRKKFGF
jgi:hypothetical protein